MGEIARKKAGIWPTLSGLIANVSPPTVTEWMGWTIGRQTSKQYGIPRGLPYLTGFVTHCGIIEEAAQTPQ